LADQKVNEKKLAKEQKNLIHRLETGKKRNKIPPAEYLTAMHDPRNILEIEDLKTCFFTDAGIVKALNGVSIAIPRGKTVALVGESGCGKTVTGLSVMRLIQGPTGQITDGQIRYNNNGQGINLLHLPLSEMRTIRGNKISMIFQEPMSALNPVFTIGYQIDEVVALHHSAFTKKQVREKSIGMLETVGIARPEGIYKAYPHELSGGMLQRVMIAIALSCDPDLIIADEPTTALDVTIQAQILELLKDMKQKLNTSILLITHDFGVVAEMADYVAVMYAGRIVEQGTAAELYRDPRHPYTRGLLDCRPALGKLTKRLYSIPGQVPSPVNMPDHCYFLNRCEKVTDRCKGAYPPFIPISNTHKVACLLSKEEEQV